MLTREQLAGIFVPLATPLKADYSLDGDGFERAINYSIEGGVSGLVPLGTTGETTSLGVKTRVATVRRAVAASRGRVPVLAGLMQCNLDDAVDEMARLAEAGADGCLVVPPFYFGNADPRAVVKFFIGLADRGELPIVLYNIPSLTRVALTIPIVKELIGHPKIIGLKDTGREMDFFQQLVNLSGPTNFRCLTGSDGLLLPAMFVGGHGGIVGGGNIIPTVEAALYRAAVAGDWVEAKRLQAEVNRLLPVVRRGAWPAGLKACLKIMGFGEANMALPLMPVPESDYPAIEAELRNLGILKR